MAVTNAEIAALPDYTAAEQLKVWKKASVDIAMGGASYSVPGRSLTRADAKLVRDMVTYWEAAVEAESNPGGMNVLVQFGEPQ